MLAEAVMRQLDESSAVAGNVQNVPAITEHEAISVLVGRHVSNWRMSTYSIKQSMVKILHVLIARANYVIILNNMLIHFYYC